MDKKIVRRNFYKKFQLKFDRKIKRANCNRNDDVDSASAKVLCSKRSEPQNKLVFFLLQKVLILLARTIILTRMKMILKMTMTMTFI